MKLGIKPSGFNFGRLLFTGMLTVVLLTPLAGQAQEEKHYISPRLQLGIHTEPSLDSPIKELISSGSVVKVLKTSKEFTQVSTPKGSKGWLKSKFLTREMPAQLQLKQLQQSLRQTRQQLQAERQKAVELSKQLNNNATKETAAPDAELQAQLQAQEQTIMGLKAEIKAWEQLDSQDKKAHKQQAEQINSHLKERLLTIASLATGKELTLEQLNIPLYVDSKDDVVQLPFMQTIKKDYLLNIVIAGISFFLGIFLMDLFNRRRHGGYRV